MSVKEIRLEIDKILRTIPEDSLQSVLDYLKVIQETSTDSIQLSKNLRKVLQNDKGLLKRLAQ